MHNALNQYLQQHGIEPEKGLGEELFLFVSSLTPIVNVDLLVYNKQGQFLLTRRNDPHCGVGWHVPGGCVRFKETFEDRVRKVAEKELGITNLKFEQEPIKVFEIFSNKKREIINQDERAHFITLVFRCEAPADYQIDNGSLNESDAGYIKWFDKVPEDLLEIQDCYKAII